MSVNALGMVVGIVGEIVVGIVVGKAEGKVVARTVGEMILGTRMMAGSTMMGSVAMIVMNELVEE